MSRSHHPNNRAAGRWATRFAALLAVFLQIFVVQTHVHALTPVSGAGYERTAHAASAVAHTPNTHHALSACALCQAQANGRAIAPSTAALERIEAPLLDKPAVEIAFVAVARSHAWQSRAPPTPL